MIKAALAKVLTVKIAAVCLAAGGAGGVALAASTGNLPEPVQRHVPGYAEPSPHGAGGASAGADRSAPPLLEVCRRYQERDRVQRRTALQNEGEFSELVARLGSPDPDKADAFCTELSRNSTGAIPSGQPRPGTPSAGSGTQRSGNGNGSADAPAAPAPGVSAGQPGNHATSATPTTRPGSHSAGPR